MGSDDSNPLLLKVLVDRCAQLESHQANLKSNLHHLSHKASLDHCVTSFSGHPTIPGNFRDGRPYGHVLQSILHAVCVSSLSSGTIIYWNRAAERLYGWKDYEATGRTFQELLVHEEYVSYIEKIREKLRYGQSWSGQFPFKRRSGELFMALVTESPLYEDGELVGVVTVTSDAGIIDSIKPNPPKVQQDNMKGIPWQQRPQIASVPHKASSISDLASKVLGRMRGDDTSRDGEVSVSEPIGTNQDQQETDVAKSTNEGKSFHMEESMMVQPAKVAAKLFAKFRKKSAAPETSGSSPVQDGLGKKVSNEPCFTRGLKETSDNSTADFGRCPLPGRSAHVNENRKSNDLEKTSSLDVIHECSKEPKKQTSLPQLGLYVSNRDADPELEKSKAVETEDATERLVGAKSHTSSGENSWSPGSSSSKADSESSSVVDSDIRWEDLKLGEEVGQGSWIDLSY